jgi:predicted transcriptional regulator
MKELASWLSTAYWLTPNEARAKMNYERLDDPMMDEVYMTAGRVPLSLAGMDVQEVASKVNGDSLNDQ